MMSGRTPVPDNPLGLSWHDSAWIPMLNPSNIMDYFSERSNPFFDRTCNNEIVKMQRLNPDQLTNMTGFEYILLHVQEPILYVIRKQHRHSPTQATPLADYYIIAGVVYQAPDLASVVNSRLLSTVHHLQSAFEEASSCSRYHPSKGYSWDLKNGKALPAKKEVPVREEPSSLFQRQRVDMLLAELTRKFPLPVPKPVQPAIESAVEPKQEIKTEKKDMKPPPEKKPRAEVEARIKAANTVWNRIRKRGHLIVVTVIIGILVWMSLVYGALLGASVCSSGRSCFPFVSFHATQVKHSLF